MLRLRNGDPGGKGWLRDIKMVEVDWAVFAEEVGKAGETIQRGLQQRDEERKFIRLSRAKQEIALKAFNKQLELEYPHREKLNAMLHKQRVELQESLIQSQKDAVEEERGFKQGLTMFAGSQGWTDAIERARKGSNLDQLQILKIEDSIMRAVNGEEVHESEFDGLMPFDKMTIMQLVHERRVARERRKAEALQRQEAIRKLDEVISYRKTQERLAGERIELTRGDKYIRQQDRLVSNLEKSAEKYGAAHRLLMNDLYENKVTTKKGYVKGKGRNLQLIDVKTGQFNEEAKAQLFETYPNYVLRFQELMTLQGSVMRHQEILQSFIDSGATPQVGEAGEIEVPEAEIEKGMAMGLTREQAIQFYKDMKAGK